MVCSLTNLGGCIAEALFNFIVNLINLALQPFLDLIYKLMSEPVSISLFKDIWEIIVYIISLFYGIILIYIGLKFIISSETPEGREKAKTSLKNTIIMIALIQVSYYLYSLIITIASTLTNAMLNLTGNDFFILTSSSFSNIGLEIIFFGLYLLNLIITSMILIIRYMCVSAGVIFFTIGIFFYFIPFLHNFGKLTFYTLGVLIFLPLFYSIIFLIASKFLSIGFLGEMKILIIIGAFSIIIISTLILLIFVIIKAALKVASPIIKISALAGAIGGLAA